MVCQTIFISDNKVKLSYKNIFAILFANKKDNSIKIKDFVIFLKSSRTHIDFFPRHLAPLINGTEPTNGIHVAVIVSKTVAATKHLFLGNKQSQKAKFDYFAILNFFFGWKSTLL